MTVVVTGYNMGMAQNDTAREPHMGMAQNETAREPQVLVLGSFYGCESKIGTQDGTLVNGNMDQNLRSPGGSILTHTLIRAPFCVPSFLTHSHVHKGTLVYGFSKRWLRLSCVSRCHI